MNFDETVAYLYSQLPMFTKIGISAYKKDIGNIKALCNALENPQNQLICIHVAGTNGKGSTCHMISAILQSAGYKVGLYTSPHLFDFRERIKVDGALCTKEFVVEFVEKIKPLIKEIQPSFFEVTVAMAFTYFVEKKVDYAVIEVGLGGRLDSTNIVTPLISVITNIGYDHMQLLGNTLIEIAYEKAGIIKNNIPVVIGERQEETKAVFLTKAAEMRAPIYFADSEMQVKVLEYLDNAVVLTIERKETMRRYTYNLDLQGNYQQKNVVTALTTINKLKELGVIITENAIAHGLQNVKTLTGLRARWEIISTNPQIILDVAHNKDGIKALCRQIELTCYDKLHIVLGVVKDKDVDNILPLFPQNATYYFTQAQIPRALPHNELLTKANHYNLYGNSYLHPQTALDNAKACASSKDLIIVCGSFFVIGELTT